MATSTPQKPPPELDAIVDRVLEYNPKKGRQMTKSAQDTITRLEAKVDALAEIIELALLQLATNQDLRGLNIDLGRRIDAIGKSDPVDPLRIEAKREAFENFMGVIRKSRRL